jgi:hypothetical protein
MAPTAIKSGGVAASCICSNIVRTFSWAVPPLVKGNSGSAVPHFPCPASVKLLVKMLKA